MLIILALNVDQLDSLPLAPTELPYLPAKAAPIRPRMTAALSQQKIKVP